MGTAVSERVRGGRNPRPHQEFLAPLASRERSYRHPERILVTGFGPFEGHPSNPSEELARTSGFDHEIVEVSYLGVSNLFETLDPERFDSLLMIGVDGGASNMKLELLAHNWNGHMEDVHGERRPGPIEGVSPTIRVGTLWPQLALEGLLDSNPIRLNYHPGSYFCNRIYFEALGRFPDKRVGFLHVPRERVMGLPQQKTLLSLLLERVAGARPSGGRLSLPPRLPLGSP